MKSRDDVVTALLLDLNVMGLGEAAPAEEQSYVDARLEGMLDDLVAAINRALPEAPYPYRAGFVQMAPWLALLSAALGLILGGRLDLGAGPVHLVDGVGRHQHLGELQRQRADGVDHLSLPGPRL